VQTETNSSTWQTRKEISFASVVMLGLGGLTLVGSALFVWLYVGRNILRRISNLQRSMQLLSDGDLESEIYRSSEQDEIAAMANSLEIFRESMIEARALSADQDKDRIAKAERGSRIEARIVEFEATVRSALDSLQKSANSMQTTAQSMSATADQSSALVSAVGSAAEETAVNVQTVSSGTEELSSSIAEIGRQVVTSAQIARKAVDEAGQTDATMQGLAENASRISVVVDLIQVIASQTNLLALNATIEAARAGAAGRGFAVVASEVKSLASQTAKAPDEISNHISGMQGATQESVAAIQALGGTIGKSVDIASTTADITLQGRMTNAKVAELNKLGRPSADTSALVLQCSLTASLFLEPGRPLAPSERIGLARLQVAHQPQDVGQLHGAFHEGVARQELLEQCRAGTRQPDDEDRVPCRQARVRVRGEELPGEELRGAAHVVGVRRGAVGVEAAPQRIAGGVVGERFLVGRLVLERLAEGELEVQPVLVREIAAGERCAQGAGVDHQFHVLAGVFELVVLPREQPGLGGVAGRLLEALR